MTLKSFLQPGAALLSWLVLSAATAHAAPPPGYALNLGVYRPSTNRVYAYSDLAAKTFALNGTFGAPGDVPVAVDYDGNGVADLALFRAGIWTIDANHDLAGDQSVSFGAAGDVPLAGDFDGDGRGDLVLFRAGAWYIRNSASGQTSQRTLGAAGDQPVVGDFDGDGLADIGVYRNGTWLIQTHSTSGADIVEHFGGLPGDHACAADWNHDGVADLCVFRDGVWYFQAIGSGVLLDTYALGDAGDLPLSGGVFTYSGTIYVRAGAAGTPDGSAAHPFATIGKALDAAVDGSVIRVSGGTYAENVVLDAPTISYAPGKYGKNNLKLLGVNRRAVNLKPASGDAFALWGSTGQVIEGFGIGAPADRGVVLIGGAGSVNASLPGASATLALNTIAETASYGVLVTGASHADIRYNHINRSRTKSGVGTQGGAPSATITGNEFAQNGYTLASGVDGNGIEAQQSSNLTIVGNNIHDNNRFGVIGINDSHLQIDANSVVANRLNGIIVCGAAANDTSTTTVTRNWIAGNGVDLGNGMGYNGLEYFMSCIGNQTVTGNTFSGNSLNGIFIGSGKSTISGNVFTANSIGITVYAESTSSANTQITVTGNDFADSEKDGIFAAIAAGSTHSVTASVGGTQPGQANQFTGSGYHGIGCSGTPLALTCPAGGNAFTANNDEIESTCPATCAK